jgi:imidazolonepropionase-like amidohydrolase
MRPLSLFAGAGAFAFICSSALAAGPVVPPRGTIVFQHVTVIDVLNGSPLADRSVAVAGGKITALGPVGAVEVPAGAKVVDSTGQYMIPGLWDMHVHFVFKSYGALMVANGVTGVRVMWGNPRGLNHRDWRTEFSAGKAVGPRMMIASNIVDGPNPVWPGSAVVHNAAEGRGAVTAAKRSGADFVKVYELIPTDAYLAIAAECKAQGIPFAGHVPQRITAGEASDAGQKSIEHLTGIRTACSTREDDVMRERNNALENSKGVETIRAVSEHQRDVIRDTFSDAKAQALFARFKKNGTWQCPTLTVLHSIAWLDDPAFINDPRLKYVLPFVRASWDPKRDFRFKSMTPAHFAQLKKDFEKNYLLVAAMNKAGVGLLAGTDEMNPYCFPGFSLHDELGLLVKAGLTPLEALGTATINPARYFGKDQSHGTVEAGKDADLVLLDANPLDDIHNTTKIRAVVADGRLYDRAALDQILSNSEHPAPAIKTGAE